MVMATAAMLMLAICATLRWNSPLMTGISGAQANHAKKHTKNAIQVRWNARICGEDIEKSLMLSALLAIFYPVQKTKKRPRNRAEKPGWADAVVLPARRWASVYLGRIAV